MENRAHALIAGLFVLVLGVSSALAIWWFRQDPDDYAYYLLETRKTVGGLNKEAVVRYRGIRAGKVEHIYVDPKDSRLILVRISLDEHFHLTRGTRASLTAQGITGLTYIALDDDGSDPSPLTAPEGELPRLTLYPTVFDTVAQNAANMMQQLNNLTERLNAVMSEKNTENLGRTVNNLAAASDGLRELPQVVAALRTALSPENMQRLSATLAHVEKTAGEAAPLTRDVRTLVGTLTQLAQRGEQLLGSGDSASTLPRANAVLQEVGDASRRLSRLLETLDETPQALIFGRSPAKPGPGEAGFVGGQP